MWIRHTEKYSHFSMFILKQCNRSNVKCRGLVMMQICVTILIDFENMLIAHTRGHVIELLP